jgi:two-component system chemotaxis response regulator CheB
MEQRLRVLIVDDTVTYRSLISRVLAELPEVEVVGTAANGKIALQKIAQLRPDLLTLDVEMPEIDGLELLRQLRRLKSDLGAIMLSAFTAAGAKATVEALELGAFDFVVKPAGGDFQTNAEHLLRELRLKIAAFARSRSVRAILRGQPELPPERNAAANPWADLEKEASRRAATAPAGQADACRPPLRIAMGPGWKPAVVALGISTGGPQALTHVLPQLPADLATPVLIVQHMPPMFTRSLAEDLDRRCALRVSEAAEGDLVQPGSILIAPGGKHMKVEKQGELAVIRITDDPPENSCRPSVDYLFRSVARVYGGRTLGVLMTGMGNDGAAGCRALHRLGAPILAQDEATCVVFGMPREPIVEGFAAATSLQNMAGEIARLAGKGAFQCR